MLAVPPLHKLPIDTGMNDLAPDTTLQIVLMAANVMENMQYANNLLRSKYFTQDGAEALRRLCESMSTIDTWSRTVRLDANDRAFFRQIMTSISRKLQEFSTKITGWTVPSDVSYSVNDIMKMCNRLAELLTTTEEPPVLSRQRASRHDSLFDVESTLPWGPTLKRMPTHM